MAKPARSIEDGMMLATSDGHPLCENFITYLWDKEVGACLITPSFVHQQESERTRLGVRVAPGTC
jgi:hypothetical protein